MANNFKRMILIVLSVIFLISSAMVTGCSSSNTATDKYLLKDGATDYKILVSADCSSEIDLAAEQLIDIFYEATGVKLEKIKDDVYSSDGKYISIGKTDMFVNTGIVENQDLGASGFEIKTVNDNIYLYGLNDTSTFYSVYELLTYLVGFDCLVDSYYIEEGISEIKLENYNITEIPDIEIRTTNYAYVTTDLITSRMLRVEEWCKKIMEVRGLSMHNALKFLPLETYYEKHPKWYAASKTQLSYTAHGDEAERELMVQEVAEVLKEEIIAQPNKLYVKLSGSDDNTYDESEAQREINEIYGAESASAILFANDVIKIIQDWFETEEGAPYKRDFKILVSAYFRTEAAPVSYNSETGEYEGNNGIRCADGVGIDYAPINIDYTHSIYDSINIGYVETLKKWCAISDDVFIWTYATFAHDFFTPYDNWYYLKELFQLERDYGVKYEFNEVDDSGTAMMTAFGNLRMYLEYKLAWDADLDVNSLIDDFFAKYFGKVGDKMFKEFEEMRVYLAYLKEYKSGYDGVMVNQNYPLDANLWSKPFLLKWYNGLTEIIEELDEYYVKGSTDYNTYYKRIINERLSPLWMLINLYEFNTDEDFMRQLKLQFRYDNNYIGGGRAWENGGLLVDSKYKEWGIE